eukprot:TRINITY_DN4811_c0_g1_i2.p1 TRINITY_DN4811_c0_g1~~TRINITY_DN4811_c0_g1_i2.p1  ORF type:complete len:220 (+),score=78.66 TRINITY_DN4811_c0_g1_i2:12-671(+)
MDVVDIYDPKVQKKLEKEKKKKEKEKARRKEEKKQKKKEKKRKEKKRLEKQKKKEKSSRKRQREDDSEEDRPTKKRKIQKESRSEASEPVSTQKKEGETPEEKKLRLIALRDSYNLSSRSRKDSNASQTAMSSDEKKKLLWGKKEDKDTVWNNVEMGDNEETVRFKKLMGMKEEELTKKTKQAPSAYKTKRRQEKMFNQLERQFNKSLAANQHRGQGLG